MHGNATRFLAGFLVAVLAVGAGGCGARCFDVTGRIKYNGSPLDKPGGQIVFVDPQGTQVIAAIQQDGTYRAIKVSAGPNRVAVYYPNPQAANGKRVSVRPKKGERPRQPSPSPSPFLTPTKYASVETSNLTVQVDKDRAFDIELTGPRIR